MTIASTLLRIVRFPWDVVRFFLRCVHRTLLSLRFLVVILLILIVTLIAYYALSDRFTPFTNNAFVQAYVVQVAPQVEGQVTAVYVKENDIVSNGQLLFEIDVPQFLRE